MAGIDEPTAGEDTRATRAARWLTDRVERDWPLIPTTAHQTLGQGAVRKLLRSAKTEASRSATIAEAAAPLRKLFLNGVELGGVMRARAEATDFTDFPPPLPTGHEFDQAVEALINFTAAYLLSRRVGPLEKLGEFLGSTFALQGVGDLFNAGLYVGYAGQLED